MANYTRRDVLKAGAAGVTASLFGNGLAAQTQATTTSLILKNGKFTTLDRAKPDAVAAAIADGRFMAVGDEKEVMQLAGPMTQPAFST